MISTAGREMTRSVEGAAPACKISWDLSPQGATLLSPKSSEGQGWVRRDNPGGLCATSSPWERGMSQRELSLGVVLLEKKLRVNTELILTGHFGSG